MLLQHISRLTCACTRCELQVAAVGTKGARLCDEPTSVHHVFWGEILADTPECVSSRLKLLSRGLTTGIRSWSTARTSDVMYGCLSGAGIDLVLIGNYLRAAVTVTGHAAVERMKCVASGLLGTFV